MSRRARIALVLTGLVVAGAVLGASAAGGALMTSYVLRGLWEPYFYGDAITAAWIGGVLGIVLGPACALGFLGRVPLWLALVGPSLATYIGGVLGEFWYSGLVMAPIAFVVSVVALHKFSARPSAVAPSRTSADTLPLVGGDSGGRFRRPGTRGGLGRIAARSRQP